MNYNSVEEIIDAGIANMECVVNNTGHDDDVVQCAGLDLITFNGQPVTNVYASGNSFIGFGANAEHLKVNRRDAKMYYLWREVGTLYGYYNFLKIRWRGYSRYNQTDTTYLQEYDVLLFDNGCIMVHMDSIPTSDSSGVYSLTETEGYTYTVSIDSPNVSFYKTDSGFTVANEVIQIAPPFARKYIIEDSVKYYTIIDGALSEVVADTLNSDVFFEYGFDDAPPSELLIELISPKVYRWYDSDESEPELAVTVTATPPPQYVFSDEISLINVSIKGIKSASASGSGTPLYAISFDGGDYVSFSSGAWSNTDTGMTGEELASIQESDWPPFINGISKMRIRGYLQSIDDAIVSVKINYKN